MTRIALSNGGYAFADDADFEAIHTCNFRDGFSFQVRPCDLSWARNSTEKLCYACRQVNIDGKIRTILLHRLLFDAPAGVFVDHRDGDGLNCRHDNLRLASHAENMRNRRNQPNKAGFRGVSAHHRGYRATIKVDGKTRFLGAFATPAEAAIAYDDGARRLFGEFARLNFN